MSENAPPPPATPTQDAAAAKLAPANPLAAAAAQHLHAILVGVFTLTSSVISALLGYYFAHEDRQSMMALEYDKLRAEHTLEVVKGLTAAQAFLTSLSVDGSHALSLTCLHGKQADSLAAEIAAGKALAPLKGKTLDKIGEIERRLRDPNITPEARDSWSFQLEMLKANQVSVDETIAARLKEFDELLQKLSGDTAATMHVYHRDRTEDYMKLLVGLYEVSNDARPLLWNADCAAEAKFDGMTPRTLAWSGEATTFAQSLGIAIKPN